MTVKSWGIASCERCKVLNAFEKGVALLADLASSETKPLLEQVRRIHEEDINDHILLHADQAPTRKVK